MHRGNAARILGISERNLYRKLRERDRDPILVLSRDSDRAVAEYASASSLAPQHLMIENPTTVGLSAPDINHQSAET